jgi:hypothetical protein
MKALVLVAIAIILIVITGIKIVDPQSAFNDGYAFDVFFGFIYGFLSAINFSIFFSQNRKANPSCDFEGCKRKAEIFGETLKFCPKHWNMICGEKSEEFKEEKL